MNEDLFTSIGGKFITPFASLQEKLLKVRAIIFDWDGVFNNGVKGGLPSTFSEADSMGINMLRFGYYLNLGLIPFTAIITGETNQTGFKWAKRERFDKVFYQVKDKVELLPVLKEEHNIAPEEVLFMFDDILDLSLAKQCGVRFMVHRKANPLFTAFCIKNKLCDYLTFSAGDENAIREVSEVVLDGLEKYQQVIEQRMAFKGVYKEFLDRKLSKDTRFLKSENGIFVEKDFNEII